MEIFNYTDYKQFVRERLKAMPKKGHGQFRKMALHLGLNSVVISQIFKGDRELTAEQAFELSEFFGLSVMERDFFILMVQLSRAGTYKLQEHYKTQMDEIKKKSQKLESRMEKYDELSEGGKAEFYSSWLYSGVRMASFLNEGQSIDDIANRLGLTNSKVIEVMEFLVRHGLCLKKEGLYSAGPARTHLEQKSPLAANHHRNWRIKSFENNQELKPDELFYTSPMVLGEEDFKRVRKILVQSIEKVTKLLGPSPCEKLACLNIDWYNFDSSK